MKKKSISMGIGIMSLLMIFIILCMVILAVLSYQNAQQSEALALREKETLTAYYEAQETASIFYSNMLEHKGKHLEEIRDILQQTLESNMEDVTISLESDILTVKIMQGDMKAFYVQVDEQLQIVQWGQGEVQ